jgi:hypothetical protein
LQDEILLDEWGKKPNDNMQTFRLPTSKLIKTFIIYKRSYKGIYKNEVQCKVRMQVYNVRIEFRKIIILQPKNERK